MHTAHIPHFCDNVERDLGLPLDHLINESAIHCRIPRDHDALAGVRDRLPDLLGDEWHERVQETKQRFEGLDQGRAR